MINEFDVGDVELLYGAAVDPDGLSDEFWGSFESSLGENCLFINFNYTDTLVKRFGLDLAHEFHTDAMGVRRRSKRLTALRRGQRVPSGI